MPTSLANLTVKDSSHELIIKSNDITIDGSSILGQNDFADKDLSNLSTTGQNILDSKLDTTQITNCITEIPQDIKLELNNGTLTLKAGSKVYVPNGSGVFDTVTIASDKTYSNNFNGTFLAFTTTSSIFIRSISNCFSGAPGTIPTFSGTGAWYDTTNNLIKISSDGGSTWTSGTYSLPIAIITISNGAISSIDQVFNGFGYIGSTIFALPGVKGLIPNGRNADGSLKNIEFMLDGVKIINNPDIDNKLQYLCWSSNNYFTRANWYHEQKEHPSWVDNNNNVWYNPETNKTYYYRTSNNQSFIPFIFTGLTFRGTGDSTKISEFNQSKKAFHAVDYNDFEKADDNNVKLTGNQTIAGVKTHINTLKLKLGGTYSTTPASVQTYAQQDNVDSTGKVTARIDNFTTTDGSTHLKFTSYKPDDTTKYCVLELITDSSGNPRTYVPTPAISDNSTKIATTAFVNNKFQVVSALPASPDSNVFYFIPA